MSKEKGIKALVNERLIVYALMAILGISAMWQQGNQTWGPYSATALMLEAILALALPSVAYKIMRRKKFTFLVSISVALLIFCAWEAFFMLYGNQQLIGKYLDVKKIQH